MVPLNDLQRYNCIYWNLQHFPSTIRFEWPFFAFHSSKLFGTLFTYENKVNIPYEFNIPLMSTLMMSVLYCTVLHKIGTHATRNRKTKSPIISFYHKTNRTCFYYFTLKLLFRYSYICWYWAHCHTVQLLCNPFQLVSCQITNPLCK